VSTDEGRRVIAEDWWEEERQRATYVALVKLATEILHVLSVLGLVLFQSLVQLCVFCNLPPQLFFLWGLSRA
jgi:hypothetical protein